MNTRLDLILKHFGWQGGTYTQVNVYLNELKINVDFLQINDYDFLRLLEKLNMKGYYL
jgi:hypothetical protein